MTWTPTGWNLTQRTRPLPKALQKELLGALECVRRALGLCACGKKPAPIGLKDKCAECWGKR